MKNKKKILIYAIITLCLSTALMNIYFLQSVSDKLVKIQEIPEIQEVTILYNYPLVICLKDIQVNVSIHRTITIGIFVLCAVLLVLYIVLHQKEIKKLN